MKQLTFEFTQPRPIYKPYQPGSANEGESFFRAFCGRCCKWDDDRGCPIHRDSMLDINDPEYPTELVIVDGTGICTAWQEVCYV